MILLEEEAFPEEKLADLMMQLEKRAAKQLDLLMAFLHLTRELDRKEIPRAMLLKKSDAGAAALNGLLKKGVLRQVQVREDRVGRYEGPIIEPVELNPYQQKAEKEVSRLFEERKVVL